MALDGIMFEGVAVRIRRPNDYNPAAAARHGPSTPNPQLNLAAVNLNAGGVDSEDRVRPCWLPAAANLPMACLTVYCTLMARLRASTLCSTGWHQRLK